MGQADITMESAGIAQTPERTPYRRLVALSVFLFLQHAVLGAWVPLYQLHLRDLGCSGIQIGTIFSMFAVAAIFAPWLIGHLADRVLPAQWLMFLCHACGAGLLWGIAVATEYGTILLLMSLFTCFHVPTLSLSNTIVFRNLKDTQHEFGYVRLWGTGSWVVTALIVGYWLSRPAWIPAASNAAVVDSLYFGAILAALLALYCLTLPATPPERGPGVVRLAAHGALKILKNRAAFVLLIVTFLLSLSFAFAYPLGGLFLRSLGVSDAAVAPWMSIGQIGEIAAFLILAPLVRRWGFKTTFLLGVACWALRYGAWSLGGPWPLVAASIVLNGGCYAFVIGLGQIFMDRYSDPTTRASAQSLHQVIAYGVGAWLGNYLAGAALDHFQRVLPDGTVAVDYTQVFLWPSLGAALCFLIVAFFFNYPPRTNLDKNNGGKGMDNVVVL